MNRVKGAYLIIAELRPARTIRVGALGRLRLVAGAYVYVGSALGGLERRIARHLRRRKRHHWHIDYLLAHARVIEVVRVPTEVRVECALARELAFRLEGVPGFGASDCRCASHLFVHADTIRLRAAVREALAALGLEALSGPA